MSSDFYTKDVTDILDLFYANDGHEPDWAAIRTRLYTLTDSHYSVVVGLLMAVWAVYEDNAAAKTLLYRMQQKFED